MTIPNILAPAQISPVVPASVSAPVVLGTIDQAPREEVSSRQFTRMQNMGLTNLRQTVLQGVNEKLNAYFFPPLYNNNKDKAQGAALTVVGGMAKVLGKTVSNSGGFASKAAGGALMWGGKAAEKLGKDQFKNAGKDHSSGNYNAFSPRNWGVNSMGHNGGVR
ncbi:hypothetical protein [Pseudomonas sp. DR208]|uniref:hypothetical protein n=1 Tax=Pseudomonas sp. DR208 TaxID=2870840 RepID=UPI001C9932D0|nr:hypothetical protein [Pseudomonas sp. DR208]QZP22253.1 hypothetical protein K5K89_05880 [Pseudomonas sp. DR208]